MFMRPLWLFDVMDADQTAWETVLRRQLKKRRVNGRKVTEREVKEGK